MKHNLERNIALQEAYSTEAPPVLLLQCFCMKNGWLGLRSKNQIIPAAATLQPWISSMTCDRSNTYSSSNTFSSSNTSGLAAAHALAATPSVAATPAAATPASSNTSSCLRYVDR